MYLAEFLTVALIHLLAVASPGPDFAVVVRESVTHGRRAGTWTALGVGCAIFLHVGYSLLGIGLIVSQSIVLFNALKWAAAAYLLYIGYKALRAQPAKPETENLHLEAGERTARGAFTSGFVTNGLNPKATLFFLSLFTVVINPHTPPGDPGRLRGVPGRGDSHLVLPGGAAVQPAEGPRRLRPHGPLVRPHHGRSADRHRSETGLYRDALSRWLSRRPLRSRIFLIDI